MQQKILRFLKGIKRRIKQIGNIPYVVWYEINKRTYSNFNVPTREESLEIIKNNKVSIARFGDGEFRWMTGQKQVSFQRHSQDMSRRLKEIIISNAPNIAIGIGDAFSDIAKLPDTRTAKMYWKTQLAMNGAEWIKYLSRDKQYLNANISRFYIDILDVDYAEKIISLWKEIWKDKNIIIVEGQYSRLGVGNNLFDNVKSIQRILVPAINAFDYYDEISSTTKQYEADLYLLAIGPTATVLAYDLAMQGRWAIDIGHIDIEYEWCKQRVKHKVSIKNRAINECGYQHTADELPLELKEIYDRQVVTKVGIDV